jgi:SAM-dependent methyltransferase
VVCGDAAALPFPDRSFDAVLVRDLLHHLPRRDRALSEAHRVLKPGGRLTLIEPNARSPLVLLQLALVPEERGALVSTGDRLLAEAAAAGFVEIGLRRRQPFPVSRMLLHPRFGAPWLGNVELVERTLHTLEGLAEHLPAAIWTYLVLHGRKP